MSDQTVYAEALIAALARAFYEDDHVVLIDTLIRDKFLRDDDMGPRLSLPAKQLRRALQFLQDEQIVTFEQVDDLAEGGSQTTKFWYIDYNHAVNVIRLRVFLLRRKLEQAELRARSSSVYLCPGYEAKRCNGRYTETEAQQVVDTDTGLFLCQECYKANESNPDPPPKESYTLLLVDNTRDLRMAMDNARRVHVQLSGKMIGNQVLRPGIYDLLQKVRSKGSGPLTSNLPSENKALDIGSKRVKGTGRTAAIHAKKLEKQGIVPADGARRSNRGGGTRADEESELNFLKNAMGQEIAFQVERGGGARAFLLASKAGQQRKKLLDAAASRVGIEIDPETALVVGRKRARGMAAADEEDDSDSNGGGGGNNRSGGKKKKAKKETPQTLDFLLDNIGRGFTDESAGLVGGVNQEPDETDVDSDDEDANLILDPTDEFRRLSEGERRVIFQARYREELARQLKLLRTGSSDENGTDDEEDDIEW
eukprot:CAMPEP_0178518740 /NCGR_PEP_ID=MMETSP0696-20121128/26434_1 /TAXON_ID=265572 /ORGANISM="Extubocellulus spinifer, Strain CCMP396" /LENGTH=480 /DNA_ID=CAMNT_0020149355 /DNA_START=33 /DNA_END=1472 /DNA_ORIENTATION=+